VGRTCKEGKIFELVYKYGGKAWPTNRGIVSKSFYNLARKLHMWVLRGSKSIFVCLPDMLKRGIFDLGFIGIMKWWRAECGI